MGTDTLTEIALMYWDPIGSNKTLVYTFLKPEEVEKDMWRVNKQLKPLKSREVITEEETQKMYRAMTLQVQWATEDLLGS